MESLQAFIADCRGRAAQCAHAAIAVEAIAPVMHRFMREAERFMKPEHFRADPEHYARNAVYIAPEQDLSLFALVWTPGQWTPIHDHVSWCVVGVYRGVEQETRYELVERGGREYLHAVETIDAHPGHVEALIPPAENIHVVEAGPGDLVFKPRDQWHTFWNAGDEPCRILEIIAPAGFEDFFRELDGLGGAIVADQEDLARLNARYGLEMRPETVPELLDRFGLQLGERLAGGWRP